MLLKNIHIKNFRGIEELNLPLDEVCVLIGENNSGKSTILDAVRLCLTKSFSRNSYVFDNYDYHLPSADSDPLTANPIEITLTFAESTTEEWPDKISQMLDGVVQIDDEGLCSVIFKVTSGFDEGVKDIITKYDFLNSAGESINKAKNTFALSNLRLLSPLFYLSSLRDAAKEFNSQSQFWKPFIKKTDIDPDMKSKIEELMHDLNEMVLENHTPFNNIKKQLGKTAGVMSMGEKNPVSIEAVPSKIHDVLSRAQVLMSSLTGAQIPITRHGSGTQSLAVILLFDTFLNNHLKDASNEYAAPILAMEEPEAHMHPSGAKYVGSMLQKLSGQKIITTHSGDLLAGVSIKNIRRVHRKDGKITVNYIEDGAMSAIPADAMNKLDFKIRSTRGSLLFMRCWLLVEGQTEAMLLPECARLMGKDLLATGICCVEYSQMGIKNCIKLADRLGIKWVVLADGDKQGQSDIKNAKCELNDRDEARHLWILPDQQNMEVFLCNNGFGSIYEASISAKKIENAIHVIESMNEEKGSNIPKLLRDIIDGVCNLAKTTE